MEKYGDFRPTPFDARGLGLPDRQNWLIVPCSRTRDSEPLTVSNFETALKMLDPDEDNEDVEVHSFRHWGPGWFEIIIVRPGSEAEQVATDIEAALAGYPVLDDEDFSAREWEEHSEWVDSELTRIAHTNDGELTDDCDHGALCSDLGWYYGEGQPSDSKIFDHLVENGWFVPDEEVTEDG